MENGKSLSLSAHRQCLSSQSHQNAGTVDFSAKRVAISLSGSQTLTKRVPGFARIPSDLIYVDPKEMCASSVWQTRLKGKSDIDVHAPAIRCLRQQGVARWLLLFKPSPHPQPQPQEPSPDFQTWPMRPQPMTLMPFLMSSDGLNPGLTTLGCWCMDMNLLAALGHSEGD